MKISDIVNIGGGFLSQNEMVLVKASVTELFSPLIEDVSKTSKFALNDHSHAYILSILERYVFAGSLFTKGKTESMVSEVFLRALQEEQVQEKRRKLKFLGESILFKSGFFAESFKRKILGIGYYIEIGSAAYKNLYEFSKNPAHGDLSHRFAGYVGLFSEIGDRVNFKSQSEDLAVLFDRYLDAESKGAETKLIELGVIPAQSKKALNQ